MRTGSKNFLPPELSNPLGKQQVSPPPTEGRLWPRTPYTLSTKQLMGEKPACSCNRWETQVSRRTHDGSSPISFRLLFPRNTLCSTPSQCLGTHCILQLELSPCSLYPHAPGHPQAELCDGLVSQTAAQVFPSSTVTSQPIQRCSKLQTQLVPEDP